MKHIAAYLLLVLGGNTSPTADDIANLLQTIGVETEGEKLDILLGQLEGKSLEEVLEAGKSKLSVVSAPSGGSSAGAKSAGGVEAQEEEAEPEPEESSSSSGDVGFSFFDDESSSY
eukprot:TRINITY_DN533_c0_g3_i1.p1 TRINITY_DN533_c0_g3~~TRINITY_DN533_c0_g3_i1.p1  ORF type:complete len:116 (-),score=53.42 TRINITY_DN533_c0_g3_i1:66-413(-)